MTSFTPLCCYHGQSYHLVGDPHNSLSCDTPAQHMVFTVSRIHPPSSGSKEHYAVYKKPTYFPWNFNEYRDFKVRVPSFFDVLPSIRVTDDRIDSDRQVQERICVLPMFCSEDGSVVAGPAATMPTDGCKTMVGDLTPASCVMPGRRTSILTIGR